MAKHTNLTSLFSDIADAIRAKKGTTGTIVADNFPDEIAGIQGGVKPIGNFDVIWRNNMQPYDTERLFIEFSITDHYRVCGKYPRVLMIANANPASYNTAVGAIQYIYVMFDSTGAITDGICACVDTSGAVRYSEADDGVLTFDAQPGSTVFKVISNASVGYKRFTGGNYNYILLYDIE